MQSIVHVRPVAPAGQAVPPADADTTMLKALLLVGVLGAVVWYATLSGPESGETGYIVTARAPLSDGQKRAIRRLMERSGAKHVTEESNGDLTGQFLFNAKGREAARRLHRQLFRRLGRKGAELTYLNADGTQRTVRLGKTKRPAADTAAA